MSKQLDTIVAGLHDEGALKVWSLIITFFGDSIVNRGGNVSASTLQTVLGRADIGAGAIRTAFSRLASDNWISREKLGRNSYYQLTDSGTTPFTQAAKRIYSPVMPAGKPASNWLFGVHHDKNALLNLQIDNAVMLPNRCVLLAEPDKFARKHLEELEFLTFQGNCGNIPEWVLEYLNNPDLVVQFNALQTTFGKLVARAPPDPLSALVARTLLIHQWRRSLLRQPMLPNVLKGSTLAAENECRRFVKQLYHRLSPSAERWLSNHGNCLSGDLPDADSSPADRFTSRYTQ